MEIEAKFRVADRQIFAELLSLCSLGGTALSPHPAAEQQRTTYFDTHDEAFRAQGLSLRVREVAGRRVAAVKRSRGSRDGLHIRDEWETTIGAELHPRHWPASPARAAALAVLGRSQAPLAARIVVHTRRHTIDASIADRPVAELCLDEGFVEAGGRLVGFRELEVELCKTGTPADLSRLCAVLSRRFPLVPESRGKRTRGLALLDAIVAEQRARHELAALSISH